MKALFLAAFILSAVSVFAQVTGRTLTIDKSRSRVDIDVKATVDSFVGKLENYEAKILVDPDKKEPVSASFAFRFLDVKTGKDDRDKKMHAWMDTPKFPDGLFTLESLTRKDGALVAKGTLKLHGQEKALSFPVKLSQDGDLYSIEGEAVVDTRGFGLPVIRMALVLKVDPLVKVRFHLEGRDVAK